MIDQCNPAAPYKEVADLDGFHQGPLLGGHRDIMRKSTTPKIKLGQGCYAYCDLKRYGKMSNAAPILRDTKDSGPADLRILYEKIF